VPLKNILFPDENTSPATVVVGETPLPKFNGTEDEVEAGRFNFPVIVSPVFCTNVDVFAAGPVAPVLP
jgi:hypothetical protein